MVQIWVVGFDRYDSAAEAVEIGASRFVFFRATTLTGFLI